VQRSLAAWQHQTKSLANRSYEIYNSKFYSSVHESLFLLINSWGRLKRLFSTGIFSIANQFAAFCHSLCNLTLRTIMPARAGATVTPFRHGTPENTQMLGNEHNKNRHAKHDTNETLKYLTIMAI
jgi:hypothetical protein